jgi:beta-N-acetylhexosaminidase
LTARAAAVLVAGMPDTTDPDDPLAQSLPRLGVGGILLTSRNVTSEQQVRALTTALHARSARPLFITTDEEGGEVSSFRAVLGSSPSPASVGDGSPAALGDRSRRLAQDLRGLGVNGDLAPVADVSTPGSGSAIGSRSYSGDPADAAEDVVTVARGLASGGVVPTVKHFPGLGRPNDDTHREMAVVNAEASDLKSVDLRPFTTAIRAGVPVVMVGHAAYPSLGIRDLPASLSPAAYRLLRALGFSGVAMTDSLGMGAVNLRHDYPDAAVRALVAGADALLVTDGNQAKRMRDAIVSAVQHGRLDEARLSEAAARVTALAGGDAEALTCHPVTLPRMQ